MNTDSQWNKQEACFAIATQVWLLSITTPVSLLLHGQVSLAAVNKICVVHEAMNSCKNLKIHSRLALKM